MVSGYQLEVSWRREFGATVRISDDVLRQMQATGVDILDEMAVEAWLRPRVLSGDVLDFDYDWDISEPPEVMDVGVLGSAPDWAYPDGDAP